MDRSATTTEGVSNVDAIFRRPAIAVLPFENLSDDPEQEYFADGLTEDIITALSLFRLFPVIARNSTFAFKGQSPDIRDAGEKLGARYVIEGSVRKSSNRVRVTAQLIHAATGHHIWAERYDRDLEDIFALQDELTGRIAATVAPQLERADGRQVASTKAFDYGLWDCIHRGMSELYQFTAESNARARKMFDQALEIDPQCANAYTGIAWSHIRDLQFGVSGDHGETLRMGLEAAQHAVELDRSDPQTHHVLGSVYSWIPDHDAGISELEQALQINPNVHNAWISLGFMLALAGRPDEGIPHIERGMRLSPNDSRNFVFFSFMARAHLTARRYKEAIDWARKAVNLKRDVPLPRIILASSLGHAGRIDDAKAELAECERIQPGYTSNPVNWHANSKPADQEHFLDGLRKAGLPE
jgi:adenylate cyclase